MFSLWLRLAPPQKPSVADLCLPYKTLIHAWPADPAPPEYVGAPIHAGRVFLGAGHTHFSQASLRSGVEQVSPVGSAPVSKIVPSGGLFPFGLRLVRKPQPGMNTGKSKRRQISLNS